MDLFNKFVYFLIDITLKPIFIWKETMIKSIAFQQGNDAQGYNRKGFKITSPIGLAVLVIYIIIPSWNMLSLWLITDISRNPIFLGITITRNLLVLHNAFSLGIVALLTRSIDSQIRLKNFFY